MPAAGQRERGHGERVARARVAPGGHHDDVLRVGERQRRLELRQVPVAGVRAHRDVDDVRAVGGGPADAGGHPAGVRRELHSRCPVVSSSWNTRTGRILTSGAAPMSAEPATGRAAMMPATAVPWPMKSSCGRPRHERRPRQHRAGREVLVAVVDPRVDHRHDLSLAPRQRPGLRDAQAGDGVRRLPDVPRHARLARRRLGARRRRGEQRQRGDRQRDRQQRQPVSQPGHDWLAEVRAAAATVSDGPSANSSSHDGGTAAGCTPEKPSAVIACGTVPLDPIA